MIPASVPADSEPALIVPTWREAWRFWWWLGWVSFGGPAGQIAIMHEELVERRRWVGEAQFLNGLNFCMVLPGPEAQQLAIYLGWLLQGRRGGLVAGVLFVLPAALLLLGLSWLYVTVGKVGVLAGGWAGLKAAVLALVVAAAWKIGRKALSSPLRWAVAVGAFAALWWGKLPFPAVLLIAGMLGWWGLGHDALVAPARVVMNARSLWRRTAHLLVIGLGLWWLPVILLGQWLGWSGTHAQQSLFFSKAAVSTFGGAYAVLPYVAQQAVEQYGWLSSQQMMDGLGLAETTPGPLIMVLQFVGFLGGWQHPPSGWEPWASGVLSAGLTTWVTFVPCFLWVFLGAPFFESLRHHRRLQGALAAITAAVAGVIANLSVWFGWHSLWLPLSGIAWPMLVLAVGAFGLLKYKQWPVPLVVGLCWVAGVLLAML